MPPKKSTAMIDDLWTKKLREALIITDKIARGETGEMMPADLKMTRPSWYAKVYAVCASDVNAMRDLHSKIKEFVETHLAPQLKQRILPSIQAEQGGEIDSARLFDVVAKVYGEFRISKDFAGAIASSLDQGLSGREGVPTINDMYLKAFHGLVYSDVKTPLRESILRHVASRRDGNSVNMKTLKNATDFLITVGTSAATSAADRDEIYHSDFEKHYLDCLTEAYRGKARAELQREGGHYTYLQWVDSRFELERDLAVTLCQQPSHAKVFAKLEELLLRDQMTEVITHEDSGFGALLDDWKENNIRQMYTLFKRVPNNEAIVIMAGRMKTKCKDNLGPYFKEYEEIEHPLNDKTLVDKNIDLFKKYTSLIKNLCKNDALLQTAVKEGYTETVNGKFKRKIVKQGSEEVTFNDANYSEVLTNFLDSCLKGDFKDIADPELEIERLELLATQFSYIKDKDVFQELYRAKLAKRLLMGNNEKEDHERAYIGFLQKIQGQGFTHKMEGMLNDRERAKETNDNFLQRFQEKIPCEFHCQVLAANHWPSYKPDKMRAIASLETCMKAFALFYKEKFQSRQLNWLHMLGQASMKINFTKGSKEVSAGTHQAHVLMYIDEQGSMSGKDIAENMGLDFEKQIRPMTSSLYLPKMWGLLCHGVSEDGKTALPVDKDKAKDPNTVWQLSPSYTHKMRKFKLPTMTSGGGGANQGVNKEEIDKGRGVVIDACVVRVMKARRVLRYAELLDLVVTQLSKTFEPKPKQIKQRIEELITREYLKRDSEIPDKFEYLA